MARQHTVGFTLIEAVIVLAILALTLTLGLPFFGDVLQRYRVRTAMHLLSSDMAMARGTAIMRRNAVVVCPRAGGTLRCRTDRDWSGGWLVFADDDGNRQPDHVGDVFRNEDAPGGDAVTMRSTRPFLRYQRDGRSANSNLTVNLCARGKLAGKVVVSNLGRVRTERPENAPTCP